MAIRTTPSQVGQIITTSVTIGPFIETASVIVDRLEDLDEDGDLSDNQLRLIEMWLAAHFVSILDPAVVEDRTGETAVKFFRGKSGDGYASTPYGQQALLLDITGRLQMIGKKRVSFKAIDLGL